MSSSEDKLGMILMGVFFCILINFYLFFQITLLQSNDSIREAIRFEPSDDNIKIWIAGIQRDASQIESRPLKTLLELNCLHSVGVHLLTREHASIAIQKMTDLKTSYFHNTTKLKTVKCAPLIIQDQDTLGDLGKLSTRVENNRIDRISALRDIQRRLLRQEYKKYRGNNRYLNDDGAIIIAGNIYISCHVIWKQFNDSYMTNIFLSDFDLWKISTSENIIKNVNRLLQTPSRFPHDVICANGMTLHAPKVNGDPPLRLYYDTFATIFLPDTFSFPLRDRYFGKSYPGEDLNMIRSEDWRGKVSQMFFHSWIFQQGDASESGIVSVRSCFGGIGIYRANVYFEEKCQYALREDINELKSNQSSIMRYANKEERPCEHVVFHECLRKHVDDFDIGVDPKMISFWRQDKGK